MIEAIAITGLVALAGVLSVVTGHYLFGTDWQVGWLATGVCALASGAAHLAGGFPQGEAFALARLFSGLAVRTVPPMLLALWGRKIAEPPLEKSLVLFIILLYLVGLLADVWLNVWRIKRSGVGNHS